MSQHLFNGLAGAGYPVVCCETRHTKAFLKARRNKMDRNDANCIAQMMRTGLYQEVHVKTRASQVICALLGARKTLQTQMLDLQNSIRGCSRTLASRSAASPLTGSPRRSVG
jgi:transposase